MTFSLLRFLFLPEGLVIQSPATGLQRMEPFPPRGSPEDLTQLFLAWGRGGESVLHQRVLLAYNEPRHLAHRYMPRLRFLRRLQTTGLAHEACWRWIDCKPLRRQEAARFFAAAARLIRYLLLDRPRPAHHSNPETTLACWPRIKRRIPGEETSSRRSGWGAAFSSGVTFRGRPSS